MIVGVHIYLFWAAFGVLLFLGFVAAEVGRRLWAILFVAFCIESVKLADMRDIDPEFWCWRLLMTTVTIANYFSGFSFLGMQQPVYIVLLAIGSFGGVVSSWLLSNLWGTGFGVALVCLGTLG